MKIKVNNFILDNVLVINDKAKLNLVVDVDADVTELLENIKGSVTIHILGKEDETVSSIIGTFASPYVITAGGNKTVEFHKEIEPSDDTVAKINEHITNIELALCEIYETLEV